MVYSGFDVVKLRTYSSSGVIVQKLKVIFDSVKN